MKEQIKEYMINRFGHFPQDLDQLTEFIGGFNASLAPSVTDDEIISDLLNAIDTLGTNSPNYDMVNEAVRNANNILNNHLPSKGDDNIEILESIIDSLTTTRGDGDLSYSHYDVIDVFNVVKQALKEKGTEWKK